MSPEHNNILSLIAATIFADRRVLDSEVQAFVQSTAKLKLLKNSKPALTEALILVWYETNRDDIFKTVKAPYFKDWFYDLLDKLSNMEEKDLVIEIMQKISRADGSVHVSERALFTLAKRHWGLT